ncbi:calcium/calmodulin-regulated receptor-like kinase 1 [Prunus yedoensis var. nudiflora]|uniref:Calcium/calmodulin-regulated receptor-like kinase 1 n=1 Tax=Prunus yedoensis var. nudiflora TaxID=2094558 RepID=A0A314XKG9_PRUYE|nr:calcium/calmodulin-regulated receptor-like kinase 1 [Prunus yedoensis var. nudiflora]
MMNSIILHLVVGIVAGFALGLVLGIGVVCCLRIRRRRCRRIQSQRSISAQREKAPNLPVKEVSNNGVDSSNTNTTVSEFSNFGQDSPRTSEWTNMPLWLVGLRRKSVVSACGIPKYSFRDVQKATYNFTTAIGQGAFGPVYKAQMSTGETFAVKVLAANSTQGQNEFLAEVLLLGRLHHKSLVNLVGYMAEVGQHMLLYNYMSNGSLFSHLHGDSRKPLSWDLRVDIALDIARGLEYLHYGAVPSVVHRDIKSSNILLDRSMRARVADFGLSRQDRSQLRSSNIRGTYGYVDPEYVLTKTFTKKCDVYSFGVLLFEIITGRNPQQGLMEYVELATIDTEDKLGWQEIVDSRLDGRFNVEQLANVADLAYKCVSGLSKNRPSMRDIVQSLSWILMMKHNTENYKQTSNDAAEEIYIEIDLLDNQDPLIER